MRICAGRRSKCKSLPPIKPLEKGGSDCLAFNLCETKTHPFDRIDANRSGCQCQADKGRFILAFPPLPLGAADEVLTAARKPENVGRSRWQQPFSPF